MKKRTIEVKLPNEILRMDVLDIEKSDRSKLRLIFNLWLRLSKLLKGFGSRGVNIPEGLTESLFCLEMGSVRVLKSYGGTGSFDTIDLKTGKRQQVKASSSGGPTSFGPKSFWDPDELYWMDFFVDGKIDGTYDIYKIPNKYVYSSKVNKGEKLTDQQAQKRRPRLSFKKEIIDEHNLKPIKSCKV